MRSFCYHRNLLTQTKKPPLPRKQKNTPAGRIANSVCIGIENAKILYKYATGELTEDEALDRENSVTCAFVGSLAGGMISGIAGSAMGGAIYEGGKKIVTSVVNAVKAIGATLYNAASSLCRGVASIFGF